MEPTETLFQGPPTPPRIKKRQMLRAKKAQFGKVAKGVGVAGLVAGFAPMIVDGVQGLTRSAGVGADAEQQRRQAAMTQLVRARQAQQREQDRLAELRQENVMRLSQGNPHLAKQILAGRILPQGATVIGGKPRIDLLEKVADAMSRGDFTTPPMQEADI